jgi:hypothetical protein
MNEITKTCTGCQQALALKEFNDSPNGKQYKKSQCKQCESHYNKLYYARRKARYKAHKALALQESPSLI